MLSATILILVVLANANGQRSVCYYTNWSQYRFGLGQFYPEDVDATLCTHLVYSFANIVGTDIVPFEWNDDSTSWSTGMYERTMALKSRNPALKIILAVGGYNMASQPFINIVRTASSRSSFAQSAIAFLRQRNFDGLDVDWEYPGQRGSTAADKQNFVLLMQELRTAFQNEAQASGSPRLLLTAAVPAGKNTIDVGYDVPALSSICDFISLMTYDIHGSWDSTTGINSPLYAHPSDQGNDAFLNLDWVARYYVSLGASRDKINIGLATYGRSFTLRDPSGSTGVGSPASRAGQAGRYTMENGFISYYEICQLIQSGAQVFEETSQRARYLVQRDLWVGYDDVASIQEKACYARQSGFGGIMFWALDLDDFSGGACSQGRYPLITAAVREMARPVSAACPRQGSQNPKPSPGSQGPQIYQPLTVPQATNKPPTTPPPGQPANPLIRTLPTYGLTPLPPQATLIPNPPTTLPSKPLQPLTQPSQPAQTLQPLTQPTQPAQPLQPLTQPSQPAQPFQPVTQPSQPAQPFQPVTQPSQPAQPFQPVTQPSQPAQPLQPLTRPSQPVAQTTRPSVTIATLPPITIATLPPKLSTTTNAGITTPAFTQTSSFDCTGKMNDFYADPLSCDYFYICANNVTYRVRCALGLKFNTQLKHCDFVYNVKCTAPSSVQPSRLPTQPVTLPTVSSAQTSKVYQPITYPPVTQRPGQPVSNQPATPKLYQPVTNPAATQKPYQPITNSPVSQTPYYKPVTNLVAISTQKPYQPVTHLQAGSTQKPYNPISNPSAGATQIVYQPITNLPSGSTQRPYQPITNAPSGSTQKPYKPVTNSPIRSTQKPLQPKTNPSAFTATTRKLYQPLTNSPAGTTQKRPFQPSSPQPSSKRPYQPLTFPPVTQRPLQPLAGSGSTGNPPQPASQTGQPISIPGNPCSGIQSGLLPHPTSCGKYVQCGLGSAFSMDCPPQLVFNPSLGMCDYQFNYPTCSRP